jgi:hypothetical protein
MTYTIYDRLLRREVGLGRKRYSSVHGIYGDRQWVEDMDIVNELEGHNGCVNALRSEPLKVPALEDTINLHTVGRHLDDFLHLAPTTTASTSTRINQSPPRPSSASPHPL